MRVPFLKNGDGDCPSLVAGGSDCRRLKGTPQRERKKAEQVTEKQWTATISPYANAEPERQTLAARIAAAK
jgi:hypothetical protein